jgi:hypothetical protein
MMRERKWGSLAYGCENATEDEAKAEDVRIVMRVMFCGSMVDVIDWVGCVLRLRGVSEGDAKIGCLEDEN